MIQELEPQDTTPELKETKSEEQFMEETLPDPNETEDIRDIYDPLWKYDMRGNGKDIF